MYQTAKIQLFKILTKLWGDPYGFISLPVLKGPARGLKFRLDLVRRLESAYFLGKYDTHILSRLNRVLSRGSIVWDCGTYLGFYSAFFARQVGPTGKVVAIEPDPRNLARTRENVELNGLHNVQYVHAALGAPLGEVEFVLSDDSNSHLPGCFVGDDEAREHWLEREKTQERIRVSCLSLDQALLDLELPKPNLVKLDIEGAEKEALKHLEVVAGESKPFFVIELHNAECDLEAWRFARRFGYTLVSMETGEVVRSEKESSGTLLASPST